MKSGKLAICLCAFGLSILTQGAEADESKVVSAAGKLIAQGEVLAKGGRWEKAKELFLQVCSEDPSNVVALHDLAVTYAHTDKMAEAADCERKALAVNEEYVPAHIELAFALGRLNDKEGAREHLKRALELEPKNLSARKNLEALNLNIPRMHWPKNEIKSSNAGAAASGSAQEAAPQPAVQTQSQPLTELLKPESKSVVSETPVSKALITRGTNMYRQGKYDVARRFFEQALENCPDSLNARSSLSVILGSGGDLEGQIREARKVLSSDAKNTVALCNLAWALAQKGEVKEALEAYQKALEISPTLIDAQAGQGVLLYRSGKLEAATAILKESLKLNPDSAQLHQALGAVLQASGSDEAALPQLAEALRLSPNSIEIKARLAAAHLACGNPNKAAELYKQVLEQKANSAEYRIGLGLALTKNGDLNGAYAQFKKAAELDKTLAAPHAGLSMLEEMKGKLVEAEQEARLAQEKDPNSQFFKESAERLAKSRKELEM